MDHPATGPAVVMAGSIDPDQFGLFGAQPAPAEERDCPAPRRRRKRGRAETPGFAQEALAEVQEGRYGLLDDTDRIVWFEDASHVRLAHDEEIVAGFIRQRYVERCPVRDTLITRHGAIRRPVLPLRLTKDGRALLSRWAALARY
jgi:hypothetical protein